MTSGLPSISNRRRERAGDARRGFLNLVAAPDDVEHDHEFVAAHAHDDVLIAHGVFDSLRDRLQQLVAGLRDRRIVDVFEAVEVDEQHRQRCLLAAGFFDGGGQMSGKEQPVGQAGQLIVMGEAIEPLLFLHQLRFDLATDQAAVFHLFDELLMPRFGLDDSNVQLTDSQLKRDCPGCDGARGRWHKQQGRTLRRAFTSTSAVSRNAVIGCRMWRTVLGRPAGGGPASTQDPRRYAA